MARRDLMDVARACVYVDRSWNGTKERATLIVAPEGEHVRGHFAKGGKVLPEADRAPRSTRLFDESDLVADVVELARRSGIRGWVADPQGRYWYALLDESEVKGRQVFDLPEPCSAHVFGNGFGSGGPCLRAVKRDGLCGLHASAREREAAKAAARAAQRTERENEHARRLALAADLDELWGLACDRIGIEPERRGQVKAGTNPYGIVDVDGEALRALLMAVIES